MIWVINRSRDLEPGDVITHRQTHSITGEGVLIRLHTLYCGPEPEQIQIVQEWPKRVLRIQDPIKPTRYWFYLESEDMGVMVLS